MNQLLVAPLRDDNFVLRDRYLAEYDRLAQQELTASVFIRAAELRASLGLATPDAIHVAAATAARCSELLTNDKRLSKATAGFAVSIFDGKGTQPTAEPLHLPA